jgi:hypothetical protein
MSKIIKLTESDLVKLVKRVIEEQIDDKMKTVYECAGLKYNPNGEMIHLFEAYPLLDELMNATNQFSWNSISNWDEEKIVRAFVNSQKKDFDASQKVLGCVLSKLGITLKQGETPFLSLAKKAFSNLIGVDRGDQENMRKVQSVFNKFGLKGQMGGGMMENKRKRKSTNEQIGRDEEGDLNFEFSNSRVLLKDMRQKKIQQYLSKLPNSIKFLAIVDGEGADFSEVDICSFPSLQYVHLKDTPNNFEENVKCEYNKIMDDLYEIKKEDIGGGFMDLVINNMNQG